MPMSAAEDRSVAEWIGASAIRRAETLEDLLALADALPQGLRPKGAPSLTDKFVRVHQRLAGAGIPHAIGGGLAQAYYGEPRVTIDIDVNVFTSVAGWPEVRDALRPEGIDIEVNLDDLASDKEVRLGWHRNDVHVFFSHDQLHAAMPTGVRRLPFAGETIPVVAPEHLVTRKALLDRPKDWIDIEAILVATSDLDRAEVESWIRRLTGPDDSRLEHFRRLLSCPPHGEDKRANLSG
jgi:hypothetical protein